METNRNMYRKAIVLSILIIISACAISAQSTAFTFQGFLKDGAAAANGNYDFEFRLFTAVSGGSQTGSTITKSGIFVENGVFSASLDFGSPQFPGADRFIEIRVKTSGGAGFSTLSPRQQIGSSPYSVLSLNSTNATQLGGVTATNYVQSGASTINAGSEFRIANQRLLSNPGTRNTFTGVGAGTSSPNGLAIDNAFYGTNSGAANTTGTQNSFFGSLAGQANTSGSGNSFFGAEAGGENTIGSANSFFGQAAGKLNTSGDGNSFFGSTSGDANTTGKDNSFFGGAAGGSNTTGNQNSAFGRFAGQFNVTGINNAFFGFQAGQRSLASNNTFFGNQAGANTTTGANNVIVGSVAGLENVDGSDNSFFGVNTGRGNTSGSQNTFLGRLAGRFNTTGTNNTFIGYNTASSNIAGSNNTAIGSGANVANGLNFATAIGAGSSVSESETIVLGRPSNFPNDPRGGDKVFVRGYIHVLDSGQIQWGSTSDATDIHACISPNNLPTPGFYVGLCSSSINFKNNVRTFHTGLELIKQLRPVIFEWKSNGDTSIGLIAEEVEKAEPILTTKDETGKVLGVKYDQISVILINALKEQQGQIEELKTLVTKQSLAIKKQARQITRLQKQKRRH